MCKEFNYSNVMIDAGRLRILCSDCYPKVKQCHECDTITKDQTYYNFDTGVRLCFDCHFKTEERIQIPLEEHMLIRREIQHLRSPYFDVLVDYAELAEFTIFDAYFYKSKCHFRDCIQRMSPSGWDAEEKLAFAVADTVNILKTVAATVRMFGMALTMMTTMKKLRVKSVIRLTKQCQKSRDS